LFRLTGENSYEAQFIRDTQWIKPDTLVREDASYAPFIYALSGGKGQRDARVLERMRAAILFTADDSLHTASKRALRWGGNFYFPMLVGHQTTPWVSGSNRRLHSHANERTRTRTALSRLGLQHSRLLHGHKCAQSNLDHRRRAAPSNTDFSHGCVV
jgi:hypothetical protein